MSTEIKPAERIFIRLVTSLRLISRQFVLVTFPLFGICASENQVSRNISKAGRWCETYRHPAMSVKSQYFAAAKHRAGSEVYRDIEKLAFDPPRAMGYNSQIYLEPH
jgi:hypothetical protein